MKSEGSIVVISSYGDSYVNVFFVYVSTFYVFFFFFRLA